MSAFSLLGSSLQLSPSLPPLPDPLSSRTPATHLPGFAHPTPLQEAPPALLASREAEQHGVWRGSSVLDFLKNNMITLPIHCMCFYYIQVGCDILTSIWLNECSLSNLLPVERGEVLAFPKEKGLQLCSSPNINHTDKKVHCSLPSTTCI